MARKGRDLAGLAALGALGYMLSKGDKAAPTGGGGGSKMPAAAIAETASEEDPEEAANKRTERTLIPNERGAAGTSETMFPSNRRPSATTAPSAATGLKNPGTGNQRGPTAEELAAYTASRHSGSGGGRGPRAGEAEAYAASRQSASNNRYPEVRGSSADSLAAENRRKIRAGSEAVEGVYPEQMVGGPGLRTAQTIAKNLAGRFGGKEAAAGDSPYLKEIPYAGPKQLPNAPTKQLTGPSKGELMTRDRAARASSRNEEMLRENARRSGLDPDNMNPAVAQRVREGLGGSDFSLGMKRGGSVKPKKMASGGMARSGASKRADGIATKGKTRGKIC